MLQPIRGTYGLPAACLHLTAALPLPACCRLQRLGAEALARLEDQLYAYGKENILELVQVGAGGGCPWQHWKAVPWFLPRPPPACLPARPPACLNSPAAFCSPILQTVGSWESKVVRYGQSSLQYGQSSLEALEERLSSIGRHNLQVGGMGVGWGVGRGRRACTAVCMPAGHGGRCL